MRILVFILVVLALVVLVAAIYVRVAPVRAAEWHVDLAEVSPPSSPNFALLAGTTAVAIDAPALAVAGRLQSIAEAEGAEVVAGSLGEGFVTYVVRSPIMGFPDFISIQLVPEEEATRLHIFSRARFGYSDLGVNAARVQRWVTAARGE